MWYNLEIEVDATSSFVTIPVCMPCSMSMSSEGCLYRGGQYRMAWGDDGTCRIVKRQRRSHGASLNHCCILGQIAMDV